MGAAFSLTISNIFLSTILEKFVWFQLKKLLVAELVVCQAARCAVEAGGVLPGGEYDINELLVRLTYFCSNYVLTA